MRKRVYDYISENPNTTHHVCAKALQITELEALDIINQLCKDGLLSIQVLPLGNDLDPTCSDFYSACGIYHE